MFTGTFRQNYFRKFLINNGIRSSVTVENTNMLTNLKKCRIELIMVCVSNTFPRG